MKSNKTLQFKINDKFDLECGERLDSLTLSYTTYGQLNRSKTNVIWICHALTADSNPHDWWSGLVGEAELFNPEDYFIVCANVIGSAYGSTSPLDCEPDKRYDQFPTISIRDNVNAFIQLRKYLQINNIHTLIGGSMGGHQAMEWAIAESSIIEHLILLATSAVMSPWSIAFNQSQRLALRADSSFGQKQAHAAVEGLKAARSIALLSYRNNQAYNSTQADEFDFNKPPRVVSYQNYQGDKLVARFNAYSYYALTKTMDSHDVGRKRGGVANALNGIKAKTLIVGIDSDVLFPVEDSNLLAECIPDAQIKIISSDYGHDGFLIETQQITRCIEGFYKVQSKKGSIGLIGLGCVGQGVYQLLSDSQQKIKSIAVKHEFKARKFAHDLITTNTHKIFDDKDITSIIEAIDSTDEAYQIARCAVREGKHFISANKKMIAENIAEIIQWNHNHERSFLYEAAVAGSIPIIRNLDEYFDQKNTQSIRAIVNGSSNYILTQIFKHHVSYEKALTHAQSLGYAETDPIADVGGFDAKYKAVILALHAFGLLVHPDHIQNYGIQNISSKDIEFAQSNNLCIKQVVCIKRTKSKNISITVMPEFVKMDDELAKTDDENNVIIVNNKQTDFLFKGAGAGSVATATAIIADIEATEKNYKYSYHIEEQLKLETNSPITLYVNTSHDTEALKGAVITETVDYKIIETQYNELLKIDLSKTFIAKINSAEKL